MGPGDKKLKELKARMDALGIKPGDIEETFIRSSGRGGQRLNKVASCVHLKHRPTGIIVKYGAKRSQTLNRFLGLRLLVDKIDETLHGTSRVDAAAEKIRRQKQRRKRRSRSKTTP
ncbi:peptide chain release factor class i/class ii [Desulfoluna butyratoxydans]|uniref:Peptide chain release factor class i/class ii n=2 Tax=Desulfoluna butyratoxydans TaxID=231438 RepID=A0A4V6ILU2_9BACT|nr:peptide chain release factor class i/class ii [Desulfoluna butyratoxydans]